MLHDWIGSVRGFQLQKGKEKWCERRLHWRDKNVAKYDGNVVLLSWGIAKSILRQGKLMRNHTIRIEDRAIESVLDQSKIISILFSRTYFDSVAHTHASEKTNQTLFNYSIRKIHRVKYPQVLWYSLSSNKSSTEGTIERLSRRSFNWVVYLYLFNQCSY